MSTDTKLTDLVVNTLTRKQYHEADLTGHGDELFVQSDHAGVFVGGSGVDALDTTNTSNCITEIPQDIKLELASNGTLTLKAGSKVYVPNGAGVFNTVTTTSDLTVTRTDTNDCMVWYQPSENNLNIFPTILIYSGPTAPTAYTFMYWYDTTNNMCKVTTNQGSTWSSAVSFPLCLVSTDGTKISAIKQVFNGFGYVGSALFILPGVKALHSAGFNSDGTLHNNVTTVQQVLVHTTPYADANQEGQLVLRQDAGACQLASNTSYWQYDSQRNLFVFTVNGDDAWINVGTYVWDGTRITNFNPKTAFHAVDYSNSGVVVAEQLPTSANNYTWFRKYANGWVEQGGTKKFTAAQSVYATVNLPVEMANSDYTLVSQPGYTIRTETNVGQHVASRNGLKTTTTIFIAAYGSSTSDLTDYIDWQVSGLAA